MPPRRIRFFDRVGTDRPTKVNSSSNYTCASAFLVNAGSICQKARSGKSQAGSPPYAATRTCSLRFRCGSRRPPGPLPLLERRELLNSPAPDPGPNAICRGLADELFDMYHCQQAIPKTDTQFSGAHAENQNRLHHWPRFPFSGCASAAHRARHGCGPAKLLPWNPG